MKNNPISAILGCADATNPEREKDDFYESPPECTHAFMKKEGRMVPLKVWECAAGKGAISEVLKLYGRNVISTDLVDRGYSDCQSHVDFLMERKKMCDAIITNPPFKLAIQFALHAHDIGIDYMAMLLKADFFNSRKAHHLFRVWRPARIYALDWRPDFKDGGNPTMNCSWAVWDGKPGFTQFDVLERP